MSLFYKYLHNKTHQESPKHQKYCVKSADGVVIVKLVNKNTGDVIATNVQTAYSFWRRFRGLMLKENMPEGSALHIAPCPSIHTFFMKFSIDILYLNKENEIVGVEKELAPGKIGKRFAGGYSVIEFPTGGICDLAVHIGDTLDFVDEGWEYGS